MTSQKTVVFVLCFGQGLYFRKVTLICEEGDGFFPGRRGGAGFSSAFGWASGPRGSGGGGAFGMWSAL